VNRAPRYRAITVGGCVEATITRQSSGVTVLRSTEPLGAYPERLTDRLEQWAREAPDRTLAAKRDSTGQWRHVSYAQMLQRARSVGQALVERGLSSERPIVILSENDLEHLTLALAAMWAGVPYAPVSPAYSLLSKDYGKLRHVLATTTPGLVFASRASAYAKAIKATVGDEVEVVLAAGTIDGRRTTAFEALTATSADAAVDAAHAKVGLDTIVKYLFTSGSTKEPKAVINTHRMLCSNLQMICQCLPFLAAEPPILVDWLPWNHTFGGNHNTGIGLYNGGTLYIDDGKPTPAGIDETLRNLREISPTIYFNVPKGFEEIVRAMEDDDLLRESLFRRVQAFFFAGAGLSQPVWDRLDYHAERTIGERVRMITGLGMTETAPASTFAVGTDVRSGHVGLPCPGVEVKLVPLDGKIEVRFRGPHVMPGYWRAHELSAQAFDEEGYYRTGDAVKFVDPAQPQLGLMFDGRMAEDFKLSTGTFVSVGPLRAKVIAEGAPCVQDAVVTGADRDDLGIMIFPRMDECRRLAGLAEASRPEDVLSAAPVSDFFQGLVDRLWRTGTGSASRVARACILREPPSIDRSEVTDKGSINQRAVLTHRAAMVDALYRADDPEIILPRTATTTEVENQ
jgi:feruloyl-CoA synthase